MTDFHTLIDSYQNCACGQAHECAIRDIEIGRGLVSEAGEILKKNGFGPGSCWRRTSRRLPLRTALRLPVQLYRPAPYLAVHPRRDHAGRGEDRGVF